MSLGDRLAQEKLEFCRKWVRLAAFKGIKFRPRHFEKLERSFRTKIEGPSTIVLLLTEVYSSPPVILSEDCKDVSLGKSHIERVFGANPLLKSLPPSPEWKGSYIRIPMRASSDER